MFITLDISQSKISLIMKIFIVQITREADGY